MFGICSSQLSRRLFTTSANNSPTLYDILYLSSALLIDYAYHMWVMFCRWIWSRTNHVVQSQFLSLIEWCRVNVYDMHPPASSCFESTVTFKYYKVLNFFVISFWSPFFYFKQDFAFLVWFVVTHLSNFIDYLRQCFFKHSRKMHYYLYLDYYWNVRLLKAIWKNN